MGSKLAWAGVGVAGAAIAIGVGEVVAGVLGSTSIVAAIGTLIISLQPPGGKDLMVQLFGTNDKLVLEIGVFLGGLVAGAVIGLLARRDRRLAYAGFAAFGLIALGLVMQDPLEDIIAALMTTGAAVVAGVVLFRWLAAMIQPAHAAPAAERPISMPRRGFLVIAGTFVAVGAVLAVVGRFIGGQEPLTGSLPNGSTGPLETLPPLPAGADFGIDGLSPIVVPSADFYRIDTRLTIPHIDPANWNVRIHGMVDREVTLTYDQLAAMPMIERYVTIACVSNEVGGRLVGNARWAGVLLNNVLESAGVQNGATQVVGRSYDGWTSGFPTAHLSGAGSEAMIVLRMNDAPLPANHGFPARLIVPGLYGYVSATKWLTEIELTTLEAFDAYWVPLGWAKQAPILTQSRIELPRQGGRVTAGQVQFAGVAWAPTRGISKVEVQLDESGAWQECELSVPLSDYSWVQWRTMLDVASGNHTIQVRATDGTGETQTADRTPPPPDGARGYHSIPFSAG